MRWNLRRAFIPLFFAVVAAILYREAFTGRLLAYGDGINFFFPMNFLVRLTILSGEFPFWNPYVFSGAPLLGAIETGILYPLNALQHLFPSPYDGYNAVLLLHYAMAGYFMYLFTRLIGASSTAALASGITFGFLGFLKGNLNHVSFVMCGTWLPLMLYFTEHLRRTLAPRYLCSLAFAIGLQMVSGGSQIMLYSLVLTALYALYSSWTGDRPKRRLFLVSWVSSVLLGCLIALPHLLAGAEFASLSTKEMMTYDVFTQYRLLPGSLPSILFPGIRAGADTAGMGASALALILSLVVWLRKRKEDNQVMFWGIAAAVFLIFALHTPLQHILYRIPVYNLFRAPGRNLFLVDFSISVLMALGLTRIMQDRKEARALAVPFIACGALIVMALAGAFFSERWSSVFDGYVLDFTSPVVYVPVIFICLYSLWMLLAVRFRKRVLGYAVIAVLLMEALHYRPASRLIYDVSTVKSFFQYVQFYSLLRQNAPDRVAFYFEATRDAHGTGKWLPPLFPMMHRVSMTDGYMPLLSAHYHRFLGIHKAGMRTQYRPGAWERLIENNDILSMLNARHVVVFDGNEQKTAFINRFQDTYRKVHTEMGYSLYLNSRALPRAYSVTELVPAEGVEGAKRLIYTKGLDPRRQGLVNPSDLQKIGRRTFSPAEITLASYRANRVELASFAEDTAFVILADQYYPGWKATIDGERTPLYRANGVLRGVVVPPGSHTIVFRYAPFKIYAAMTVAGITALVLFIVVIVKRRVPD
jgi:hypothetical protein